MNSFDHLGQTASHMFNLYETWAKSKGINYTTLAVFHTLVKQTTCTQKHICQQWALPKQTVSATCHRLFQDDLIVFSSTQTDQREKLLHLTPQGKHLAIPMIDELDAIEQATIQQFGHNRAEQFINEMMIFLAMLEKTMLVQHKP